MRKALLMAVLLAGASCTHLPTSTSTEQTTDQRQSSRHDSTASETTYRERIRLTPVEVAADTLGFETQLEVLPTGQLKPATYTSRGRRATVRLKVDAQGKVTGRCGCDAEKATIASLDRELTQAQSRQQQQADARVVTKYQRQVVHVPQPYTAWYDWLSRFVAIGLLVLLLVLFLIHRFSSKSDEYAL